jgi:hypothetical protein
MGMHPVLTFLLAWLLCYPAKYAMGLSFRLVNRLFRSINIAIRGWPPAHCDADGDFKS